MTANDPSSADAASDERAMFAHEIRGALTIIAGYAEMLRRVLEPEERERALAGIDRAVARADHLLSKALDAGSSVAACDDSCAVDLPALVREIAEEHSVTSGRTIMLDLPETLRVAGDPAALGRVIDNLVSNALKYSLGQSAVEVSVRRAPGLAVLEVADRGPGIAVEDRDAVFEPYVRLARDDDAAGTGLGLPLVKRIVEAHGGTISIDDRDGGGTLMRVELPFDPAERL